jgi:predicted nucleic acid-binding protein
VAEALFVDTGAWVALADHDDQYHRRAAAAYPELLRAYRPLVTTDLVVAETHIILRLGLGHGPAMAFLSNLRASACIERVWTTADLQSEAEAILGRYADQDFSLTDAVSFALMRRRGLRTAFAFDRHFATAGFACLPG